MGQPVLLAIDDDVNLLGDIERELHDRYARHYQVVCVRSPAEARAHLADFAASGVEVALVLAGRSTAEVPASELLAEVRKVHPRAKRALVVAFGDWGEKAVGDEIFEGVADGRFDHYVLRPADSPDELFHQTISSMLLEWWEANRAAPHTVHIVGESWTGRAYELREALKQCAVVHNFCLADSDEGRALVAAAPEGAELPLVVFPNGMVLENPSNAEVAMAAGGAVNPERMDFDVIIVGPVPRACRPRCTAPRKGSARWWSTRAASAARPRRARSSGTTSGSRAASAAGSWPRARTTRRGCSGRSSCSCSRSRGSPVTVTSSWSRCPTAARCAAPR